MSKLEEFRKQWTGRTFKCMDTGTTFTIPDDVRECDFFKIGNGFLDVGRYKAYSRYGGNVTEVITPNCGEVNND